MKRKFSKKDILKYLGEVNKKLEERGKFGEIMICGGAVMTLVYKARNSTNAIKNLTSSEYMKFSNQREKTNFFTGGIFSSTKLYLNS